MDTLQVNGSRLSFRGEVNGNDFQAFYTLTSEKEKEYFKKLAVKGTFYFEGTLEIPEEQRNFSGFDYRKYLRTQGVYRLLKIEKFMALKKNRTLIYGWYAEKPFFGLRNISLLLCRPI